MDQRFKNFLGIYIIILHFVIMLTLIYERLSGGYIQQEFSTLLGITLPMFGGFSASIIRYFSENRYVTHHVSHKQVNQTFRVMSSLLPGIFAALIVVSIVFQANNLYFTDFEDAKTFILSLESIFAVSCGILVYSIFKKEE